MAQAEDNAQEPAAHSIVDAPASATVEAVLRSRLSELLGGWRGAVETASPTLVYVVVWSQQHELRPALIASLVAVLVLALIRLAQRQTTRYALSSVFATVIAAAVAARTGQAEDVFLPGILWNLGMGIAAVVSILVRWPIIGLMVAAADPAAATDLSVYSSWRRHAGLVAVCAKLTWVIVALFVVRLAIMVPLYFDKQVTLLGIAKLVLGWPAYLLAVAVMASMLIRGRTPMQ